MNFYVQRIKDFLEKKSFDFNRPDISLYNFHPQLRVSFALVGVFFNDRKSYLSLVWPTFCFVLTIHGLAFQYITMIHGLDIKDYAYATECFCYLSIIGCIPPIYAGIILNKDKIFELVEEMDSEFRYICSLKDRHRKEFLEGQVLIWQLCLLWLCFELTVGGMFLVFPILRLMFYTLYETHNENKKRPLAFPLWLPHDDPYRTPNYETFFVIEFTLCACFVQIFSVYVLTMIHLLMHKYILLKMIVLDFEQIFEGLDESVVALPRDDPRRVETQMTLNKRFGRIVEWHITIFRAIQYIASLYGPTLVYQVMFSSIIICVMAYQVAVKLEEGQVHLLFIMLALAGCIQLWIPCYIGTIMKDQAFAVGDACWHCGWHETPLGLLVRQDIIIFVMRAQQPVTIKFTGLPEVSLETFSSILSAAYSYFNMLRQYN